MAGRSAALHIRKVAGRSEAKPMIRRSEARDISSSRRNLPYATADLVSVER